ncbi:hypothetical protein [Acidaminococcus timonensis]|uniref:hypothetical protein n=1 Tax=Acidaminococcus timonensis TaxID=1871002 RepID=UPI003076E43E
MDKDKELARLRALDTEQKARVLEHLEMALKAADVHVFLSYEPHTETVHIKFVRSQKPEIVVNVNLDNPMAMMYDIFKVAGRDLLEEA